MKKTREMLNEKMQVKLPESLSTENIMANIENSKAEIVEMPKKRNTAKKVVPMVASLLLVVGLVGAYFGFGFGQKNLPVQNEKGTEVVCYQSYDKIYKKFDALHKETKKNNWKYFFNYVDEEIILEGDVAGDTAVMDEAATDGAENVNGSAIGSTSANKEFGTTNTQEKDVDEGDIIKTDGNYLYIANKGDNAPVSIVDCTTKEMKEASEIGFDEKEQIKELYVYGDILVVVGNLYEEDLEVKAYSYTGEYYYGGNNSDAFVKVYNISDREKPELVTEYSQQGGYDNSRMIGSKLYTISKYYVNVYNENYRDDCIPEITVNDVCEPVPAGCISVIENSEEAAYAVITTLDLNKDADPESSAILGNCNNLYASSKGLFLTETIGYEMQDVTKIYKFDYTDTGVKHKCTGKVNGYLNDQFSMSYDGEYFRIATTADNVETDGDTASFSIENRANNLYILNNEMEIVGKVEDLAKGELIESVRFVGNMAYVVTFRQTDPLFVIDLSNPEKPTVKGELKIPGFSEYLHPITQNLIVGVGQDGTETGTNGDCKVSLFDVTDPYAPKETVSLPVAKGSGYVSTGLSYNHKLYITLSDTEFAVPFFLDWYVDNGEIEKGGSCYIRYKLQDGTLCEIERYYIGEKSCDISGATYVENTFYIVYYNYDKQSTEIVAFDLTTHKEIDRITTYEK